MSASDEMMSIHKAIRNGDLSEVSRLIDDDVSRLNMWTPFGTWLHDAASHGELEIVRWLVSKGVDVDSYNESNERPAICEAAAEGHVQVVKALIECGALLDVSSSVRNPLMSAILGGVTEAHSDVAKPLIGAGIDTAIRYPNLDNMDALEFAREWGRDKIAEMLQSRRENA